MNYRIASTADYALLADWNQQLIQDEGHRNPMTVGELEKRMRGWLESGEYQVILFEEQGAPIAYALYRETESEIYLRQFFVTRAQRRKGFGQSAIQLLFTDCWSRQKRWTVEVLTRNQPAVSFWRSMGYNDYSLSLEILPNTGMAQEGA